MRAVYLGVMLAAIAARAQSLDPLIADPQHYRLEVENQWVRAIREHMGPHESMPMHQHPQPGAVIVFLTDRHNRLPRRRAPARSCAAARGT